MLRGVASAPLVLALLFAGLVQAPAQDAGGRRATAAQLESTREYIRRNWRTLTRSNRGLAAAAIDPKFRPDADGRWPGYVARTENLREVERDLRAQMTASDFARAATRVRIAVSTGMSSTTTPGRPCVPSVTRPATEAGTSL